jgi:hypothetical protein
MLEINEKVMTAIIVRQVAVIGKDRKNELEADVHKVPPLFSFCSSLFRFFFLSTSLEDYQVVGAGNN